MDLLAAGGDLSPARLVNAYRSGIFPWYNAGEPILWWSPNPRTVIFPAHLKVSRSLRRTLRRGEFHVTLDTQFRQVMEACAAPRRDAQVPWAQDAQERPPRKPESGTWISAEIIDAPIAVCTRWAWRIRWKPGKGMSW